MLSGCFLYTEIDRAVGRMEEPEDGDERCEMLSSGQDTLTALMSSLQLFKFKSSFQQVAPIGLSGLLVGKGGH